MYNEKACQGCRQRALPARAAVPEGAPLPGPLSHAQTHLPQAEQACEPCLRKVLEHLPAGPQWVRTTLWGRTAPTALRPGAEPVGLAGPRRCPRLEEQSYSSHHH